jgi:cytochrome c oxidase subunit 3
MKVNVKNKILWNVEHQPFHLANPSPWPLFCSILVFQFLLTLLLFFHNYSNIINKIFFGTLILIFIICLWFYNIIIEATFQGNHTKKVQKGLKMGMILFITSEIMFFFSFFWCFFHSSLAPSIWIGNVWPPIGVEFINFWHLPLLNTIILLSSGVSLTLAHRLLVFGDTVKVIEGLLLTIAWGLFFTFLQYTEYKYTTFSINDSVYGSIFFLLTGFHGFHVILGTILLISCLLRFYFGHFIAVQHIGFECSIWYWHFVDVVWIFLYLLIYCWGC